MPCFLIKSTKQSNIVQIYFCKFIIDPYLANPEQNKYIDEAVLQRFWEVGGVRIEDNIWITKDGYENLTTAPKL
jgi:Xaa-Pro dipeptidase